MAERSHQSRIHLTAVGTGPAGSLGPLGVSGLQELKQLLQPVIGESFEITGDDELLRVLDNDDDPGRFDDAERAQAIEAALADDSVRALVTLRGGAWFTRILDDIDFTVLTRRQAPIWLFGFSEMTSLLNIAGCEARAVAVHGLGPCYLQESLRQYAWQRADELADDTQSLETEADRSALAREWASSRYRQAFIDFFREVGGLLHGQAPACQPIGRLLRGDFKDGTSVKLVGGNLSVLTALLASPYRSAIDTRGKWLALEDLNESLGSLDRMLTAMKFAGMFENIQGVVLGDFHHGDRDLTAQVADVLNVHLADRTHLPVVQLENFGHVHPMAPLLLHRPVGLCRHTGNDNRVTIDIDWSDLPA